MYFLTGTLTEKNGPGVALCALDGNHLEKRWESGLLKEPNWLLFTRDKKRLFSVCEDRADTGFSGRVCELSLNENGPTILRAEKTGGDAPCYLALSPDEKFLYCANYASGSIAVFPVEGGLSPRVQLIENHGVGFDKNGRQRGPHMHQITFMPDGAALAVDLGLDALCLYARDAVSGCLTEKTRIPIQKGTGPRHVAYLNENAFYLTCEMGGLVSLLTRENGGWRVRQTLSTLPARYEKTNYASAIRLSADGRALYVSNRGHDTLARYDLSPDGEMTLSGFIPCGAFPRDFIILPDGRFLVADQGGNDPALAKALGGVKLLSPGGEALDFLPLPAAVCIAPL